MFIVKNGVIQLTQGDTASLSVTLKQQDGTTYTMISGDSLTFTARNKVGGTILMTETSTTNTISLTHAKTKLLPVGQCCFDIELKTHDSKIYTVIGVSNSSQMNMQVLPKITAEDEE